MPKNREKTSIRAALRALLEGVRPGSCLLALLSSALLAFGIYEVHARSGVTEGGVLGLTLLLEHWFSISPSVSGLVLNVACYALGGRLLGRVFLCYSAVAAAGFSLVYQLLEHTEPLWPELSRYPLAAALLGAVFVGLGAGLSVRAGGAPSGDDALAMSIAHAAHMDIRWAYLLCDLVVLGLSLSYIPVSRIGYSLLTVLLSGQLVGLIQKLPLPKRGC